MAAVAGASELKEEIRAGSSVRVDDVSKIPEGEPMSYSDGSPRVRIDAHTHILMENWPSLKDKYGYGGFIRLEHHEKGKANMYKDDGTFFREIEDNCWSLSRRLRDCEALKTRVQAHVLSTVPVMFSYWSKPKDCLDLSAMINDHIAECSAANPRRFIGLGTVPMQDTDLAIDELKRCKTLGLKGVEIGTHINDKTLADPSIFKFFQEAERLGMSVFIHPWDMVGKDLMEKYWLPWLVGMPAECSLAMCSLMMGGVLERCPDLRVMIAHGGGSLPGTMGRIQHGYDVRPDLCAVDSKVNPMDFLGTFWADSCVHDTMALDYICKVYHDDKVALGSDYPFPLGEYTKASRGKDYAVGEALDEMDWTEDRVRKVECTNSLDWLGMDVKEILR